MRYCPVFLVKTGLFVADGDLSGLLEPPCDLLAGTSFMQSLQIIL